MRVAWFVQRPPIFISIFFNLRRVDLVTAWAILLTCAFFRVVGRRDILCFLCALVLTQPANEGGTRHMVPTVLCESAMETDDDNSDNDFGADQQVS